MAATAEDAGEDVPPTAPLLMQALRSVGYTTPAALADLVDNSIAAGATRVSIDFSPNPEPVVAIIDDGRGMDQTALTQAMRFGSLDPRLDRAPGDLGRFGLGLKTASLSQCRSVRVVSLHEGAFATACWDIDECERRGSWWLSRPGIATFPPEIIKRLRGQQKGTAVIWNNIDRLTTTEGEKGAAELDRVMALGADHLAMAFHRFLAGEFGEGFDIKINERPLPRLDPFLQGHVRGQTLHAESFTVDGAQVDVSPFVLPAPSRLEAGELAKTGGRENLRTGYGFYIYRGGRLVVPGGWFRIVPGDELYRLARIRVDVPVALDHLWKVDIRKTMAEPPAALRPELRRIVGAAANRSRRVYTRTGVRADESERVLAWTRELHGDGLVSWKINREHPAVAAALREQGSGLNSLLRLIEATLPIHDIHVHIANDLPVAEPDVDTHAELEALGQRLWTAFANRPEERKNLVERLHETEPFSRDPVFARDLAQRLKS
jgi:hypothetical protein